MSAPVPALMSLAKSNLPPRSLTDTLTLMSQRVTCKRKRVEQQDQQQQPASLRVAQLASLLFTGSFRPRRIPPLHTSRSSSAHVLQLPGVKSETNKETKKEDAKEKDNVSTSTTEKPETNNEMKEEEEDFKEKDVIRKDKPETSSVAPPKEESSSEVSPETKDESNKEGATGKYISKQPDVVSSVIAEDLIRYDKLQAQVQSEIEAIDEKRRQTFANQVELWGVYKHGLAKIAGLGDLGDAPDAILPGNF
jgi:hypothetical protein